tara:strand:+ start:501 stop:746 length:246 start_codon:yes stop_codon:yes gene_type:complete
MSVLNNADDIKSGSSQVSRVYSGSTLVWSNTLAALWTFNTPAAGTTILGSSLTLSAASIVNLGDGTIVNMTAPTDSIDHTY